MQIEICKNRNIKEVALFLQQSVPLQNILFLCVDLLNSTAEVISKIKAP